MLARFTKIVSKHAVIVYFGCLLLFIFCTFFYSQKVLLPIAWHRYTMADVALFLNISDAGIAMEEGNYYFGGQTYDLGKAEYAFTRAVSLDPTILWGNYQLARIYFVEGDLPRALSHIQKELEANPGNLRALYIRGLIDMSQNNFPAAEADFKKFTLWAPTEWAGYNDLSVVLAQDKKYQESKQVLLDAFKNASQATANPWLFNSLGLAELNLRQYAEARDAFNSANVLAQKLTVVDWHRAYPGNDPKNDADGLDAFRSTIQTNILKTEIATP